MIMCATSLITGTNFEEVGQGKLWFRKLHAMKARISVKAMETLGLIWGMRWVSMDGKSMPGHVLSMSSILSAPANLIHHCVYLPPANQN